jgi:hypothetical protein
MKKRIYISGPMSDMPELNRLTFENMASHLRTIGFLPIIPHDNGLPITSTYNAHMVRDIEILLSCDGVVLLQGWNKSRGALIEAFVADQMQIPLFYEGKTYEQDMIDWDRSTQK